MKTTLIICAALLAGCATTDRDMIDTMHLNGCELREYERTERRGMSQVRIRCAVWQHGEHDGRPARLWI